MNAKFYTARKAGQTILSQQTAVKNCLLYIFSSSDFWHEILDIYLKKEHANIVCHFEELHFLNSSIICLHNWTKVVADGKY
jgi:hypothetical protein